MIFKKKEQPEAPPASWRDIDPDRLGGRARRLWHEWRQMDLALAGKATMAYEPCRRDARGLPVAYEVVYRLRSIRGVENVESLDAPGVENPPLFADEFRMRIDLPEGYPCVDAPPEFRFLTTWRGRAIAHPWHPNIRYFGEFAGRVCLNFPDTYASLAWAVDRVARYLRYELYHAIHEPPYPEDPRVARWVVRQAEPRGWVPF